MIGRTTLARLALYLRTLEGDNLKRFKLKKSGYVLTFRNGTLYVHDGKSLPKNILGTGGVNIQIGLDCDLDFFSDIKSLTKEWKLKYNKVYKDEFQVLMRSNKTVIEGLLNGDWLVYKGLSSVGLVSSENVPERFQNSSVSKWAGSFTMGFLSALAEDLGTVKERSNFFYEKSLIHKVFKDSFERRLWEMLKGLEIKSPLGTYRSHFKVFYKKNIAGRVISLSLANTGIGCSYYTKLVLSNNSEIVDEILSDLEVFFKTNKSKNKSKRVVK